jgi:hypothetical protein
MTKERKINLNTENLEAAAQTALEILSLENFKEKVKKSMVADEIESFIKTIQEKELEGFDIHLYENGLREIRKMDHNEFNTFIRDIHQELKLIKKHSSSFPEDE